jgi:hypothetical protein
MLVRTRFSTSVLSSSDRAEEPVHVAGAACGFGVDEPLIGLADLLPQIQGCTRVTPHHPHRMSPSAP